MQKYSYKCPACGHVIAADAENDGDAANKLMSEADKHMKEVHPEMPMDPNMGEMIKKDMKKGE
ncbi:DUF1059 domain-containing protein [Candidatus Daviesbacteria bacterium]|nr:DUF1059 domain-containing protein [Candidatus Daviesbacteria bacterium]